MTWKYYQGLNHGFQGDNPMPLPSNQFDLTSNNGVISRLICLVPNVMQKPILTIFPILCSNDKKLKFIFKYFKKICNHLYFFLKKKIFNLTENAFEFYNLIHFNNDLLKIFSFF